MRPALALRGEEPIVRPRELADGTPSEGLGRLLHRGAGARWRGNEPRVRGRGARGRPQSGGKSGYDDLAAGAERFEAFGVRFLVASLDDIIRSKEAVGRPKDRDDVALLRALKVRLELGSDA